MFTRPGPACRPPRRAAGFRKVSEFFACGIAVGRPQPGSGSGPAGLLAPAPPEMGPWGPLRPPTRSSGMPLTDHVAPVWRESRGFIEEFKAFVRRGNVI